jgi:hypothetical protein
VDVDPLDPAAALAGVEAGAVDEILDRVGEVGVVADVGGVLAAELEVSGDQGAARRRLDRVAARHAAGEADEAGLATAGEAERRLMVEVEVLEHARRHAGRVERGLETLGAKGVWAECFRSTVLPAASAGRSALTAVR